VGLKRDRNEDAFSADEALGLFVVADGTGANAAGETAARITVDIINKSVRRWSENDSSLYELLPSSSPLPSPEQKLPVERNQAR
jgi:protein phosphatase